MLVGVYSPAFCRFVRPLQLLEGDMTRRLLFVFAIAGLFVYARPADAATCESLAALTLQNGHVTMAQMVAPGAFTPPAAPRAGGAPARGAAPADGRAPNAGRAGAPAAGRGGRGPAPNPYAALPAFCRVALTLTPSADSDIKAEVWLPDMA